MRLRHFLALAVFVAVVVPSRSGAQGFNGAHSVDGVDVWAVGGSGVIYRSLDGGLNWTQSTLGD